MGRGPDVIAIGGIAEAASATPRRRITAERALASGQGGQQ
jgi:hypothetical protein